VRVVADSHALVWFAQGSDQLSAAAADSLREAEATEGIVISTATLIDLWYVTQTTKAISTAQLAELRTLVLSSWALTLHPMDLAVLDAYTAIARDLLKDPWDRFIVATAQVLQLPLVTKDRRIRRSGLAETIW
jgi:PIN domain nuclease of toxin-antitoxin system